MANNVCLDANTISSDFENEPWTLVKSVKKIIEPIQGNGLALVAISDDGLSLLKDSISLSDYVSRSTSVAPFQDQALSNLACVTASFGVLLGGYEIQRGSEGYYRAKEISDEEGEHRAKAKLFSGTILTNASALCLAGKISETFSLTASAGIDFSSNILAGIGSAFAMGVASLGLYRCYRFRSGLNREIGDCKNALQFLLDKAFVNEDDRKKIEKELPPALVGEERKAVLQQKLLDKAEAKVKAFKRRTSTKAFNLLRNQAASLKGELNDEKVHELIRTIKRENSKKIALFAIALATATVAFVVFWLGFFVSAGSLPLILSVITSAIYLASGLTSFVSEKLSKNGINQSQVVDNKVDV